MNRIISRSNLFHAPSLAMAVLFTLLFSQLISANYAVAAGRVNWTSTIKNEVISDVEVTVHYGLGHKKTTQVIRPGQSYTFEFGADCPVYVSGFDRGSFYSFVESTYMTGMKYINTWVPHCYHTNLKIQQFSQEYYRNSYYSFTKD